MYRDAEPSPQPPSPEPEPLPQMQPPEPEPLPQPGDAHPVSEWPPGGHEVVTKFWKLLFGHAFKKTRDEHASAEVVEEAILRHLRNPVRYPVQSLVTLVYWEASKWFDRQKKHLPLSTAITLEEKDHATEAPDALDDVIRKHDREIVSKAVGALRAGDRDIITRYYLHDEPIEDIAVTLGIEVNAARVRKTRALKRLRTLLEGN